MSLAQGLVLEPAIKEQSKDPWSQDHSRYEQAKQKQSFELDFNAHYDRHIKQPVSDFIAEDRKKSPISNILFWALLSLAMVVGLGLGVFGLPNFSFSNVAARTSYSLGYLIVLLPYMAPLIVLLVFLGCKVKGYFYPKSQKINRVNKLNSIIVPEIFKFLNIGCTITRAATLSRDDLLSIGYTSKTHRFKCEDEITGEHNGIAFKMMEVEIIETESAKSWVAGMITGELTKNKYARTKEWTIFQGVYLLLDVPKSFQGRVNIKQDSAKYLTALTTAFSNMKRVRLEDPEFEKAFQVYSDNQTEARYLLTTTMMQSLTELRFILGGSTLEASFYNGKLALLIDCPYNLFEIDTKLEEEEYREEAKKIIGDLNSIFSVIDAMDLKKQGIL